MIKRSLKVIGIVVFILSIVVFVRYRQYKQYSTAVHQLLNEETKLVAFYVDRLRFPHNASDYRAYLSNEYLVKLDQVSFHVMYDSVKEEAIIYSDGFDRDDDGLAQTYLPYDVGFIESLFLDGDVLIERATVPDFLYALPNQFIAIRDGLPDSTLQETRTKLYKFAMCYCDTVSVDEYPLTLRMFDDTGVWVVVKKSKSTTSVRLYGYVNKSVLLRLEKGLSAEIEESAILSGIDDDVSFGFPITLFTVFSPRWCE